MTATLFQLLGSALALHYDASDASKLFTDTGGTVLVADGNTIKCWKPNSDAALQVNLTEATNGPTYRANYSATGFAGVEFDGVNDALEQLTTGFVPGSRMSSLAVVSPISAYARSSMVRWFGG